MEAVVEEHEVLQAVDAHPWNRLFGCRILSELADRGLVLGDQYVACHALRYRRKTHVRAEFFRIRMAVLARHLRRASVGLVAERNRLLLRRRRKSSRFRSATRPTLARRRWRARTAILILKNSARTWVFRRYRSAWHATYWSPRTSPRSASSLSMRQPNSRFHGCASTA